ncbi:MAG: folate family ECF transporter S component [Clostridiales bacterium]|nr:folate family ECF transporter S component [Clostridiales bacterium]
MKKINSIFKESAKELKNTRCITLTAMLAAMSVVLSHFTIVVTESLKISFFFLPSRIAYYLFGPFVGSIFGATIDVLNFFIKPTGPFHPGFTINAALSGLIFGLILYKKPLKLSRVFVASMINMIIVNLILNTFWIYTIIGKGIIASIPLRIIKNIALLPFEATLLYLVIKSLEATGIFKLLKPAR